MDILCLARRCGAKGCERCRGHDQDQAYHSVRGLVPNWLQVRHQLPAANSCARWWLGQGHACVLYDLQLHGHRGGLLSHWSQVRPHVAWQCCYFEVLCCIGTSCPVLWWPQNTKWSREWLPWNNDLIFQKNFYPCIHTISCFGFESLHSGFPVLPLLPLTLSVQSYISFHVHLRCSSSFPAFFVVFQQMRWISMCLNMAVDQRLQWARSQLGALIGFKSLKPTYHFVNDFLGAA